MRVTAFLAAAALAFASVSAMACPMQTAAKSQQTVASSGGNSTPIPARSQQQNNS
jgi:hypothetical protein